jgi:hypothetical protein
VPFTSENVSKVAYLWLTVWFVLFPVFLFIRMCVLFVYVGCLALLFNVVVTVLI